MPVLEDRTKFSRPSRLFGKNLTFTYHSRRDREFRETRETMDVTQIPWHGQLIPQVYT